MHYKHFKRDVASIAWYALHFDITPNLCKCPSTPLNMTKGTIGSTLMKTNFYYLLVLNKNMWYMVPSLLGHVFTPNKWHLENTCIYSTYTICLMNILINFVICTYSSISISSYSWSSTYVHNWAWKLQWQVMMVIKWVCPLTDLTLWLFMWCLWSKCRGKMRKQCMHKVNAKVIKPTPELLSKPIVCYEIFVCWKPEINASYWLKKCKSWSHGSGCCKQL